MKSRRSSPAPLPETAKEQLRWSQEWFRKFSYQVACYVGSPAAFALSILLILGWIACGPRFHFSDTWQLVVNTGTTIVTFLMVFLIQNTQNRDAKAIHLKLDELIRAVKGARNRLVALQDLSDEELMELEREFARLRDRSQRTTPSVNGDNPSAAKGN